MPKGDSTWHDCIIFDFFYSEYWHNRLVLSFSVKPEVGSFEGVWVCVLVIVFCVFIYCNLPDLLQQTSGSAQFPLHAGSGSGQ